MLKHLLVYFRMARPSQLLLIGVVYAYGGAIAGASGFSWDWRAFAAGLLALLLASASVHLANEYADYWTDRLTKRTPFSGGSGALVDSGLPRGSALAGAWLALLSGMLLAACFACTRVLGIASLLVLWLGTFFGWMYSLKPLALAWRGWGELDNSMLGGLLLPLYGYSVVSGSLDWFPIVMSLPFFGLAFVNLLATTWPDRQADARVGKFTLATRWDPQRLRSLYRLTTASACVLLVLIAFWIAELVYLLSFIAAPFVLWGASSYTEKENPFPSVAAMVCLVVVQFFVWVYLG